MKPCVVEVQGADKEIYKIALQADSLFDAAQKAIDACSRLYCVERHALLRVEVDGKRYAVKQEKVN